MAPALILYKLSAFLKPEISEMVSGTCLSMFQKVESCLVAIESILKLRSESTIMPVFRSSLSNDLASFFKSFKVASLFTGVSFGFNVAFSLKIFSSIISGLTSAYFGFFLNTISFRATTACISISAP